jgi:hypothetical protein
MKIIMITLVAACMSALLAKSSARVSVCPPCEAFIAQVTPFYYKKQNKIRIILTLFLLYQPRARQLCLSEAAQASWCARTLMPPLHKSIHPFSKIQIGRSNCNDYFSSRMHISFVGQKQLKSLGVSAF